MRKLTLLIQLFTVAVGDLTAFESSKGYDSGQYGHWPLQKYYSTTVQSPRFNVFPSLDRDDSDGLYIFIAPHGFKVAHPGPLIVDDEGTLVWTDDSYGKVFDLRVQSYAGKQYLTFWTGDDHVRGHGIGRYHMVKQHPCMRMRAA